MPGLAKVIVLDPDPRAGRQVQLGFAREGVPALVVDLPPDPASLELRTEDTDEAGLVIVGGDAERGLALVRRVRTLLDAERVDAPLLFAGANVVRSRAIQAGADEVVLQPAYLRDVVTIGRLLRTVSAERRSQLTGNLAEMSGVLTLVRALSALGRSAVLTLIRGLRRGEVRFFEGEVTSAQVGLIHGQAALHQLLLWTDARFDFHYEDIVRRQQIPLVGEDLWADAERFLAGIRDAAGQLSPSVILEQDLPRIHTLGKQIPTEVHGVLRMFDGHRMLADVLEDSPYRVFETLRVTGRAVEAGLLRATSQPKAKATWRAVLAIEEWLVGSGATAPAPTAPKPADHARARRESGRPRTKRRANTPLAVPVAPKADIDWGQLVPRTVGAEVGPLAGVVPAAQRSGEIMMPPRERLEALMDTGGRARIFPTDLGLEPTVVFDDPSGKLARPATAPPPEAGDDDEWDEVELAARRRAASHAEPPPITEQMPAVELAAELASAPPATDDDVTQQRPKLEVEANDLARQLEAEAAAAAEAEAKAKAKAKAQVDADTRARRIAKQRTEAENQARRDADAKVRAEADAKVRAEADARALADAEAKRKAALEAEAIARVKRDEEARIRGEAERQRREAERIADEVRAQNERAAARAVSEGGSQPTRAPRTTNAADLVRQLVAEESGPVTMPPSARGDVESQPTTAFAKAAPIDAGPSAADSQPIPKRAKTGPGSGRTRKRASSKGPRVVTTPPVTVEETAAATVVVQDALTITGTDSTVQVTAVPLATVREAEAIESAVTTVRTEPAVPVEPPPIENPIENHPLEHPSPTAAGARSASAIGVAKRPTPIHVAIDPPPAPIPSTPSAPTVAPRASIIVEPPDLIEDEPSDGVVRVIEGEEKPRPLPPPPKLDIVDDRPPAKTGEISSPGTRKEPASAPSPRPEDEPSILINDLSAVQSAIAAVVPAQVDAPMTLDAKSLDEELGVSAVRKDATGAFTKAEEEFFREGDEAAKQAPRVADGERFDDLDAGYEKSGFWDRLRGKKKR